MRNNPQNNNFCNIVVFGDGLNDMGKWGKLTNYKYPPTDAGFYESRWTNGKVWVEHFADALKLPILLENNYAMGGATTGLYNINEPLKPALQLDEKNLYWECWHKCKRISPIILKWMKKHYLYFGQAATILEII